MMLHLTAPSKTFLLGEYVALQGGPTLVLTSPPYFTLTLKSTQAENPVVFEQIHKDSPAGKFLLQHAAAFKGQQLTFCDPHQSIGGFGASTAQFLLVNFLKKLLANFSININCNANELLNDYHQFAWDGAGIKPSGADLIAQAQGGISYFYREQQHLQKLAWPFADVNYYLLHTGSKLATHQHLKEITHLTTNELANIVLAGLQHLQTHSIQGFIECIKQYALTLHKLNLVADKTINLLTKINKRAEVLAAKGCGALGADVVLVLVQNDDHNKFIKWLSKQGLHLITHGNQAGNGLQINTEAVLSL